MQSPWRPLSRRCDITCSIVTASSPLERPRWHAHYRKVGLVDQAAVLAEGLLRSHAWVDGKRTHHVGGHRNEGTKA
jgi:prophage maintenance system killer protein